MHIYTCVLSSMSLHVCVKFVFNAMLMKSTVITHAATTYVYM